MKMKMNFENQKLFYNSTPKTICTHSQHYKTVDTYTYKNRVTDRHKFKQLDTTYRISVGIYHHCLTTFCCSSVNQSVQEKLGGAMELQNTVKEALNALYHHPDDAVRMQADRWLQDFQRTIDAWQVIFCCSDRRLQFSWIGYMI